MLNRSSLFMLAFLVVHMIGNLSVFFGPNVFNAYGHKVRDGVLPRCITVQQLTVLDHTH
jgi:hypothetical protein